MEIDQLKEIWKEHEKKLDEHITLNTRLFEKVNLDRARATMRSLLFVRMAEVLCFLILTIALFGFIAEHLSVSASTISALILVLFAMVGLIGSIGQITLIGMIDYSGTLLNIQNQLIRIRSHSIQLLRLIILSVPFYMAYIFLGFKVLLGIDLYSVVDLKWFVAQIIFSLLLIGPALWLFRELNPKRMSHPWIRKFVPPSGTGQITQTLELLNEIEEFRRED